MTRDFEEQLRLAVRSYASEGVRTFDPARIAQRARAADAAVRHWWWPGHTLPRVEPRVVRIVLLVALLGAALALAVVGSRQADPPLPRPGLLALGASNRILVGDPGLATYQPITAASAHDGYPVWSPDGTRLAFGQSDGRGPIEVTDADGGNRRVVTAGMGSSTPAAWSTDGRRIAFVGYRYPGGGEKGLYVVGADGTAPIRIVPGGIDIERLAWSPDDSLIAFVRLVGDHMAVHVVDVASGAVTVVSTSDVGSTHSFPPPLGWQPGRMALLYARAGAPDLQDIVLADRFDGTWRERPLVTDLDGISSPDPMWLDGERFVFVRESHLAIARSSGTVERVLADGPIAPRAPGCVAPDGSAVALPVVALGTLDEDGLDDVIIFHVDGRPSVRIRTGFVARYGAACSWQAVSP